MTVPLCAESMDHFTSAEVSGWPLWKRTPERRWKT